MASTTSAGLLARQPRTAAGESLDSLIISAIVDDMGSKHVLSYYSDDLWILWPFFSQSNVAACHKSYDWSRIPKKFRDACKAAAYRY